MNVGILKLLNKKQLSYISCLRTHLVSLGVLVTENICVREVHWMTLELRIGLSRFRDEDWTFSSAKINVGIIGAFVSC